MPSSLVKTLVRRFDEMEKKLEFHLEESGAIKADLMWLKKTVWVGVGAVISLAIAVSAALLTYLLRK